MPARATYTLIGAAAILMWAMLAVLATSASAVPPFQLVAMTMAIGAAAGGLSWTVRPGAWRALRAPAEVWSLGIAGLFGYHAFYFTALRLAPPLEANLVNYLWPLLIVLFSALLPGERLRLHHVVGALLGLAGAGIVVLGGDSLTLDLDYAAGYAAAFASALIWAGYSVLSRRLAAQPSDVVIGYTAATAVLALLCHLSLETTVWPATVTGWAAVVLLGLFPTGLAFLVWDIGVKRGDIQVLGALSYFTPVASTLLLVAAGRGEPGSTLWIALALVVTGAVVAAQDMLRRGPA